MRVRLDLYRRTPCAGPAATQEPPRGLPAPRSTAAPRRRPTSPHAPEHPLRLASNWIVERTMGPPSVGSIGVQAPTRPAPCNRSCSVPSSAPPSSSRASTLPQARRILDVGCGTGQLLRRARPCYPLASLIGIDLALDGCPGRDRRDRPSAHGGWCPHPRRRLSKASAPSPAAPMLRRRPAQIPTDLGRMLALHRLAVVGCNRTRWFRLPDVQVIAVRKTTTTRCPRSASSARRWTRGQR